MRKIVFQFQKTKESFDEGARVRPCTDSGGSEYSADDTAELFDLVNSFNEGVNENEKRRAKDMNMSDSQDDDSQKQDVLISLFGVDENDDFKEMIRKEVEIACRIIGEQASSPEGFKRQVMSRLRLTGLDAGVCKTKWSKIGQFPAGDHEYMDVIIAHNRYIIEVSLSKEFTIARPTNQYQSLLDVFPQIFVGSADELKQVVRLMCSAGKQSMKTREMDMPPWRRNRFMLAKWFGPYKRTTNDVGSKHVSGMDGKRSVGFEGLTKGFSYCRGELGRKGSLRVGNLAQMLNG